MSDLPPVLGVQIEVIEKEGLRVPKVTLNNQTFRTEAGAMYYMIGDITMESKMPSVGGFLKAALSSESIFRPTYTGTRRTVSGTHRRRDPFHASGQRNVDP